MEEVSYPLYSVLAVYILFLIGTDSFDHHRTLKLRLNDKARSNKVYLRHGNISVLRLRRWLAWSPCV